MTTPKPILFRIKMKPTASKRDVMVNHPERIIRASSLHLLCFGNGTVMATEDIESIEIIGIEEND